MSSCAWGSGCAPQALHPRGPELISVSALAEGMNVPHGAVRAYVMGERGARNETPTEVDIERMSHVVEEDLRAGA